jgi:K+-sensing histidine kinase KdpD
MNGNNTGFLPKSPDVSSNLNSQKKFDESLEFISLIVHDLQGPIASMKTLTKFLISGKYNPENDMHAALVRSSKNALERTEAIIHDLLDSANDRNFGIRLNPEQCDLRDIIKDSLDALIGSAYDYGVSLKIDMPKNPALATVDRYYLVRVIDNLIYNALKHSPKGKNVFVKIEKDKSEYVISINDEGSGLNELDKDSIFEKYNQVSLRKTGQYRGIGLGLYFCKLAVTVMGGKIWAESNAKQGASFKIALAAEGNV